MEKRIETVVRGTYKIFNLILDFPFLRVYQMLGIADHKFYLLVDYDGGSSHGLGDEMNLWKKVQAYPFPPFVQYWENNQVFSFVLRQAQGTPWLELAAGKKTSVPAEIVSLYLPELVKLFKALHELQISAFDCEVLISRINYSADKKFEILPAALYHLAHRKEPVRSVFAPTKTKEPVSAYTRTLGLLFRTSFSRAAAAGDQASGPLQQKLPAQLVDFLDFLIAGKAETFQSVLEHFEILIRQKDERKSVPSASKPKIEDTPSDKRGLLEKIESRSIWKEIAAPIQGLVRAMLLLGQMAAFVFFLVGSYYWDKMRKLGHQCVRWYSGLQGLNWEEVKRAFSEIFGTGNSLANRMKVSFLDFFPVSEVELLNFTRYLALLLHAGVPLARSIGILHEQTQNRQIKEAVAKLYDEVVHQGSSLSKGMSASPKVFSDLYVNMVSTGEVAGHIDQTLGQVADYLESTFTLKRKLKSAVTYPIVIAFICILFFLFFVYAVLPKFMLIFEGLSVELPLPTRILSKFVILAHSPAAIFSTLIAAVVLFFPILSFFKTLIGKERIDYVKLQIPIFGPIYKTVLLARFCATFGALLDCGIPLLNALDATGKSAGNEFFHEMVDYLMEEARVGTQLSVTLEKNFFFPKLLLSMVQVGEESGQLGKMLHKLQEMYEGEINYSLQRFLALIEPALMGMMGLVVGFVVLAVFLPVYRIASGIT